MDEVLQRFRDASWLEAAFVFLVSNFLIFATSVAACWLLGRLFAERRIFSEWEPFSIVEFSAVIVAVILNGLVSLIGWFLWRADYITLRNKPGWNVVLDVGVMLLAMDFGMYVLHRVAHHRLIYPLVHRFHHRHEMTNPYSLFMLHPLEVLGFSGLMIIFLVAYPISPPAMFTYLILNVVFGTIGHSGVEPFPPVTKTIPVLRLIGTSTFHAEHHEHKTYNFGFYTLIWDRLFRTLDPDYWDRFTQTE